MSSNDNVTKRLHQLLRTPTSPGPLPDRITTGLSSTDALVQRAALTDLQTFIRGFFFLKFRTPFWGSLITSAGILILLLSIGGVLVSHRIYHRRFWPFRFERRAQGIYVVPNAINCFLICEGFYAIITIAFNFVTWQAFSYHNVS